MSRCCWWLPSLLMVARLSGARELLGVFAVRGAPPLLARFRSHLLSLALSRARWGWMLCALAGGCRSAFRDNASVSRVRFGLFGIRVWDHVHARRRTKVGLLPPALTGAASRDRRARRVAALKGWHQDPYAAPATRYGMLCHAQEIRRRPVAGRRAQR